MHAECTSHNMTHYLFVKNLLIHVYTVKKASNQGLNQHKSASALTSKRSNSMIKLKIPLVQLQLLDVEGRCKRNLN